ncbi:MAG: hydrolase, partial [Alphaproteobacteria bacterium]
MPAVDTSSVAGGEAEGRSSMPTNRLPHYDDSVNTTGCCPQFNPQGWDERALHFQDKRFVHVTTRSAMHIPLNMGRIFDRVQKALQKAGAYNADDFIVLSQEVSPWKAEHFFAVDRDIPGEEM